MLSVKYNDVIMIVTSNKQHENEQPSPMAAKARLVFGNPMPQYLNAITIATNQAMQTLVQHQYSSWMESTSKTKGWQQSH
jgi:hypothetical protein